jgi:hypothetical protein
MIPETYKVADPEFKIVGIYIYDKIWENFLNNCGPKWL